MEREFVYIELEDGSKAIKADKEGYPTFTEAIDKDGVLEKVERGADVFHLLDKVPELSTDLKTYKEQVRSMKELTSVVKQKGILSDDDFSSGKANEKLNEWITSAVTAQEKVKNFNDEDMEKVKKIDEMKSQLEKARDEKLKEQKDFYETQLNDKESIVQRQTSKINSLMIDDKFSQSKFIKENCSHIPVSVITNTFSKKFKLKEDDGNYSVIGYQADGNEIASRTRALEYASFDEALEVMMKEHPDKDYFFGGTIGNGSGNGAGRGSAYSIDAEIEKARKAGDNIRVIQLKQAKVKKQNGK